jgi:1-acyl-sn-glycerol-3-phosphate acyltransferase
MIRSFLTLPFTMAATVTYFFPVMATAFMSREQPYRFVRRWAAAILGQADVKVELDGREYLPSGPVIVMANHESLLDVPALFHAMPYMLRFVAKKELQHVPILGVGMRALGHIFVDRKNHSQATSSLNAAAEEVRGGTSIVVFPEGTRSETEVMLPFKKGGFVLAIKAGVPIVPVTIIGSRAVLPRGARRILPGRILLRVHPAVDASAYRLEDKERLMEDVRALIESGRLMSAGENRLDREAGAEAPGEYSA